jgi:methanogenic corrinoid protein MtbC1
MVDLGVGIKPERFIEAISENKPQVAAMSALLTTTIKRNA